MNVQSAIDMAVRLEGLIRRARTFGKSRDEVLEEILFVVEDLRNYADRLDAELYADYCSGMDSFEKKMLEREING
jgi:hypothetical protein